MLLVVYRPMLQHYLLFQLSYSWNKDTKAVVSADSDTNTVQYHVTGRFYETWAVDDFNRVCTIEL